VGCIGNGPWHAPPCMPLASTPRSRADRAWHGQHSHVCCVHDAWCCCPCTWLRGRVLWQVARRGCQCCCGGHDDSRGRRIFLFRAGFSLGPCWALSGGGHRCQPADPQCSSPAAGSAWRQASELLRTSAGWCVCACSRQGRLRGPAAWGRTKNAWPAILLFFVCSAFFEALIDPWAPARGT
jgi:hypothetical protein